jgi:2Fe-2S ferredoxin
LELFDPHNRDIIFSLTYLDETITVATYNGEFRNLMVLINEKIFVEDFGECKGIGRCGTCLVEVKGLGASAAVMERNEKATLEKCLVKKPNLRLSCQLMINDALHNSSIKIVEEREDVREF